MIAWPDSDETGIRLARAATVSHRGTSEADSVLQQSGLLAGALAYRGRLGQSSAALMTMTPPAYLGSGNGTFADLALLNAIPRDSARAAFKRCLAAGSDFCSYGALGWWAAAADTVSIQQFAHRSDSIAAAGGGNGIPKDLWRTGVAVAHAYLALARGDTVLAMRGFAGLPDSLCVCFHEKVLRVRILEARGANREAAKLLDQVPHSPAFISALDGMWALEGGRVYERLGQTNKAITNYQFVADVWRYADPELQLYVAEAKAALKRLGAESRRPPA